jgi:predicted transcriptional regulator
MGDKSTFSVRLDPEKRRFLDELAENMDRPRSYLVEQAIDQYLEYHRWKTDRVAEGLADLDSGNTVPHEEVFAKLRRRRGSEPR